MASKALHQQLDELMASLFDEGLLNEQFHQLQMLQGPDHPNFVNEVITMFFGDCERIFAELDKFLNQAVANYQMMNVYIHQLKGSSSSVGARNVELASIQFREFCEAYDKEGCQKALQVIKQEYLYSRSKLETMVQLRQKIQAHEAKK